MVPGERLALSSDTRAASDRLLGDRESGRPTVRRRVGFAGGLVAPGSTLVRSGQR